MSTPLLSRVQSTSTNTANTITKKRRKRRKKHLKDIFDLPGVQKMVLSELAQKIIGCVVGENVTGEKPWIYINKELIVDNLELHEESSEFLPLKKPIIEFPEKQFLIGYIPDETREYDEFYICYTVDAIKVVTDIIAKRQAEQEERLNNAINKSIREWASLGTEVEVDEAIVKNNRPLLEVEIESQFPIFPTQSEFKTVKAEQRRDGYMELKCVDTVYNNIYRKKIDMHVQVAPQYNFAEAQTICTYPTNAATQYTYEVEDAEQLLKKCNKNIVDYSQEHYSTLSDLLEVNGSIDFYTDDYTELINDIKYTSASAVEEVKEYTSFMDVELCQHKMIADAVWHPMWSGTVAVAYCSTAPSIYRWGPNTEDKAMKAVHDANLVLIWSCVDGLHPKLILESPREVFKLSFCDFDENILIGGCSSGQVVIWDIRQKLNKVEELEILTNAQQKYRTYMHSLMGWMKNIHNLSLVRPAAVSDIRYSHRTAITGINWISPYFEFSKIGNLTENHEEAEHSMQFITCSKDGAICIWDLLKKPTIQPGGFKMRKLRRLKKRPSELTMATSPYAILHLNLKPIYKVNVPKKDPKKMLLISSCSSRLCHINYVEANPEKTRKNSISERVIYKPSTIKSTCDYPRPEVNVGTMEGEYVYLKWDGQDFDSGEVVNSEIATHLSYAKYHDGPVNSVDVSSLMDVVLTVGGKVFALWHKDFPNRPLVWRTNKELYTTGEFNIFEPYTFENKTMTGNVENWMIAVSSKSSLYSLIFSSGFLTCSAIHPLTLKKIIYGAGDKQGIFRLFYMPEDTITGTTEQKEHKFVLFISREIDRKKKFLTWQAEFNAKNAEKLKKIDDEIKERAEEEEMQKKAKEKEQMEEKDKEEDKDKGPQAGKYIEWIIEQRKKDEAERIKTTVIKKKQLDTKELEKRRKPLQKLDEENERKKRKQKQRLRDGELIFRSTVATLFPEVVKEKPPPPPNPYASEFATGKLESVYYEYIEACREAESFINENLFSYEFNWREVLTSGKKRKRTRNKRRGRSFFQDYYSQLSIDPSVSIAS